MAAIDDAIAAYIGATPTPVNYPDSIGGQDGSFQGLLSTYPAPSWVSDTDINRDVLNFSDTSSRAGNDIVPGVEILGPPPFGHSDFTVVIWIKRSALQSGNLTLFSMQYAAGYSSNGVNFEIDTVSRPRAYFQSSVGSDLLFASTPITSNTWAAVGLTYTKLTSTAAIYVNGTESGYFSGQGPSDVATNIGPDADVRVLTDDWERHRWYVGCDGMNASGYNGGTQPNNDSRLIGPVIWDRVLTGSELTEMNTIPSAPSAPANGYSASRLVT